MSDAGSKVARAVAIPANVARIGSVGYNDNCNVAAPTGAPPT